MKVTSCYTAMRQSSMTSAAWIFFFSLKDIASSCTGRECCRPLQLLNTYSTLQVSQVDLLDPLWSLLTDRLVCSACRPLLQSWERELKWAKKVGSGWVRAIPRGKAWSYITKSLLYHDSQLTAWIIDRPQATGRYLNVVIYWIYCCGSYEWERNFISLIFWEGYHVYSGYKVCCRRLDINADEFPRTHSAFTTWQWHTNIFYFMAYIALIVELHYLWAHSGKSNNKQMTESPMGELRAAVPMR